MITVPALAEERITRFSSDIAIQPDSSLHVTETIELVSEGDRIRRGIFRDIPTRYRGRNGSQVRVGLTFDGAMRDGMQEKAATEAISNGIRIRLGNADKFLDPGAHRYVIRYRTTRQIGRFKSYDELYWNVTGNGWIFPIDSADARITLPTPARFGRRAAYTGPQGSTAGNARVVEERPGEIAFSTTAPLAPNEGLTVAVAFPKGVVADPSGSTRAGWWLSDWGPPAIGAASLAGLLGFLFVAWKRAGRDPRPGTVVPLFTPPDDLTPAAMRYLLKMDADDRAFAAALVDLGVRGHLRMVEEDGGWLARDKTRLERLAGLKPLPSAEAAMLGKLVSTDNSIVMEQKNHAYFGAAKKALDDAFKGRFEGRMFKRNWGWALAGLALFFAAMWLTSAAIVAATGVVAMTTVLVAVGAFVTTALFLILMQGAEGASKFLFAIASGLFGLLAVGMGFPLFVAALTSGWWLPLLLPLLALPVVVSAFFWIAAPTREGRQMLDRIAGFRQYLSITEGERLDRLTPPKDTPELFERFLPYAIALGVENRWAERFEGVLAASSVRRQDQFGWYSGSRDPWRNPGSFTDAVGSSLAGAVSAASTAPGSSSGSGGGGSSGGGGGGGGGGGW